jgi:hypothetical protein
MEYKKGSINLTLWKEIINAKERNKKNKAH